MCYLAPFFCARFYLLLFFDLKPPMLNVSVKERMVFEAHVKGESFNGKAAPTKRILFIIHHFNNEGPTALGGAHGRWKNQTQPTRATTLLCTLAHTRAGAGQNRVKVCMVRRTFGPLLLSPRPDAFFNQCEVAHSYFHWFQGATQQSARINTEHFKNSIGSRLRSPDPPPVTYVEENGPKCRKIQKTKKKKKLNADGDPRFSTWSSFHSSSSQRKR